MTQAFNLSQFANKVNTSGQADLTTAVTGTLPVANGGTNQTTYTNGQLLIGNTTGNTLTKSTLTAGSGVTITNGAGSITIAASAGQTQAQIFTGPGTWTCPATTTQVKVTVVGGGGGGGPAPAGIIGGRGGVAIALVPVSSPVPITIGSGGAGIVGPGQAGSGGTSSFGAFVSATGGVGTNYPNTPNGANGTGTVSTGTILRTGNVSTFIDRNSNGNFSLLAGTNNGPNGTTAATYSTTSVAPTDYMAGAGTGPIAVTQSGVSGAVVVEWVS